MAGLQERTGASPPARQNQAQEEWKNQLAEWRLSSDRANRCNRNLMQYSATVAALLGIGAGSGGLSVLAKSVERPAQQGTGSQSEPVLTAFQVWAEFILAGVIGLCIIAAVFFMILLARTFRQRLKAEREADHHLDKLVRAKPENFLPKAPEGGGPSAQT